METQKVTLRINAFFGDEEVELAFPGNWQVKECRMAGHDRPALSDEAMLAALASPIGTGRLGAMVQPGCKICVLFDDLPKPTPASRIVPFVLEELKAGGATDDQIRFVCAPGTHRALTGPELEAKLGRAITEKYMVYNHSIWENVVHVGQTTRGTPVWVNREFASCDLRIGIGSIFPHLAAGFGGGGKMVLPGISGMETISHHHSHMRINTGVGRIDDNVFRADIEEAARIAGLHFKVDSVLNNRREVVGLFAGDFVQEHRAAVALARRLYSTAVIQNADVLVLNSYPDEFQVGRTLWPVQPCLKEGGDVVLLTHSWEGQSLHQLSGRFGSDYGGRAWASATSRRNISKASRLIVMSPRLSRYDRDAMGAADKTLWCPTWADVLAALAPVHGTGTQAGVFPCTPLQIPAA